MAWCCAPTVAGRIDEINLAEGRLVGSYHVGQPLTLGSVRQPGTSLVFFPADEFCLYTLDITKRPCANILYTAPSSRGLGGLPGIASDGKGIGFCGVSASGGADRNHAVALPTVHHEPTPGAPILHLAGYRRRRGSMRNAWR